MLKKAPAPLTPAKKGLAKFKGAGLAVATQVAKSSGSVAKPGGSVTIAASALASKAGSSKG